MASYDYDVLSIGAGTGGCASSMRSADLGKKVALIEEKKNGTGGTCVNRGCIPTKALLHTARVIKEIREAEKYGVKVEGVSIDPSLMQKAKKKSIMSLKFGLDNILLKKRGIVRLNGRARLIDGHTVEITDGDKVSRVTAENIIISTGSEPAMIPACNIDGKRILTSTEALELAEIPQEVIVVGGGVVGLEFACLYNAIGSHVTVVEMLPKLIGPLRDTDITDAVQKVFEKDGISFRLGVGIEKITASEDGCKAVCTLQNGDVLEADYALVAIGRSINTKDIGLEEAGIEMSDRGLVIIDSQMRTSVPSVYAVGDITEGPQLSHKAQRQGVIAAEAIAGMKSYVNYDTIPSAIFTDPEIAMVGFTEEDAKVRGIETIAGKMNFTSNEKAITMQQTDGIIKVTARKDDHVIIGGHIFGPEASILIGELALAVQKGLTLEDIADNVHTHPTLSEIIMETCKRALGKAFDQN